MKKNILRIFLLSFVLCVMFMSNNVYAEETCFDGIQNQNEIGIDVGGVCHLDNEGEIPMPNVTFKSISGYNAIFNVDMSNYYPRWVNTSGCLNSNLPNNTYYGHLYIAWYSATGIPTVDPLNGNPSLNLFAGSPIGQYEAGCSATSFDMSVPILGDSNHWDFPNIKDGNYSVTVSVKKLQSWFSVLTTNSYFRFNFTVANHMVVVPQVASCSDGLQNQDETDIDIGGVCNKLGHNPVLIIPGVLGTEISKPTTSGPEKLWLDIVRTIADPLDEFMDPLQFNHDLTPFDSSLIIDNVIDKKVGSLVFDYTDGLLSEFEGQGYEENKDAFLLPYDWRYGVNEDNVNKLKQKIEEIRIKTGSDKVDVVAHSTGGLLLKKYTINNNLNSHIDKAVFVGVPNTGAPEAIKALIQGSNFGVPLLSDKEMEKIAKNLPVVYDLAPSQEYYNRKGSYIKIINQYGSISSINDLDFTGTESFLINDHSLNSQALSNSNNLHTADFDNYDLRTAGVDLYAIDGCKAGTFSNIIENRKKDISGDVSIDYLQSELLPGDGTVPLESSTNLPISQSKKYYSSTSDHSKMLSQNGSMQQIVNLITGSNLSTKNILGFDLITQDISKCKLNGKAISIYSPVDIDIVDNQGNHSGLLNGGIQNDIPNASFEIMGDHKFVYLPDDEGQTYTINLKGTDTGTFTLKNEDISDNIVTQTEVFSNIPVTTSLVGELNLGSVATLDIDNGDGNVLTINPSAVIDANQSKDLISPVTTAEITGEQGQDNFYRSDVSISLNATDPIITGQENQTSGILNTNYSLDDVNIQTYTTPILVSTEGLHTLKFFSTDKAGNNEIEQSISFTIDKESPVSQISIDTTTKDLKIESEIDAVISKDSSTYTITDKAGNTTKLLFQKKFMGKLLIYAKLVSIQYNDEAKITPPNSSFVYVWNILKNPPVLLSQTIAVDKSYLIEAIYDIKKNQTIVYLKKKGTTIQKKVFNGVHVSKLTIDGGVVGYEL